MLCIKKHLMAGMMGMIIFSFPSCDGILEDIYDQPAENSQLELGFNRVDLQQHSGTIYVDATSYMQWNYIDLHERTVRTADIDTLAPKPYEGEWDLAIHRYDCKTNGGSALETDFTSLEAFRRQGQWPEGIYTADVDSQVIVDMSNMMNNYVSYQPSPLNPVIGQWLNVDKSSMPPVYTLSGKVYLVRLKDGSQAALRLTDFMNEKFDKGFMTIDYIYPVEF